MMMMSFNDTHNKLKEKSEQDSPQAQIGGSASNCNRRHYGWNEAHCKLDLVLPKVNVRIALALAQRLFRRRRTSQQRRSVIVNRPKQTTGFQISRRVCHQNKLTWDQLWCTSSGLADSTTATLVTPPSGIA